MHRTTSRSANRHGNMLRNFLRLACSFRLSSFLAQQYSSSLESLRSWSIELTELQAQHLALVACSSYSLARYFIIRYSVELAFTQYALVLEQPAKFSLKNIWTAIQSSRAGVRGAWWAVAIRLFVPNAIISLIVVGISISVNFATTIVLSFAAASLSALAIKLIAIFLTMSLFIINALVMPLYALATYYLYDSVKRT